LKIQSWHWRGFVIKFESRELGISNWELGLVSYPIYFFVINLKTKSAAFIPNY
jgi:hypothetical protein